MTCLAERSGPVGASVSMVPSSLYVGTPALRKYLLTMMSVANWLQASGTSASFISNTTEPSALLIRLDLLVHLMVEKTSVPAWVNRLVIRMALYSLLWPVGHLIQHAVDHAPTVVRVP